ncbi:MAG: response regulator transcription factor [Tannerella sp.]|jgi:DNA-binding response OmpR family regulator|nr:response regulator transcription factor [Tannerella sp.]
MDKIKLLLVRNGSDFAFIFEDEMEIIGDYEVRIAFNGREGLDLHQSFEPDAIVSDMEMSVMDGKEMVHMIRKKDVYTPIIFIISNKKSQDVVEGLRIGADVCLKKPLIPGEVDAQVRCLLRRTSRKLLPIAGHEECVVGSFIFNASNRYLIRNGIRTDLTKTEVGILGLLVKSKGHLVKKEDISRIVFEQEKNRFITRTLDVHMRRLREKIGTDHSIKIETIRKQGYILKDGFVAPTK